VKPSRDQGRIMLWKSPDELRDQFHLDVVPGPSGVPHHLFRRK
jgi:hypothetical protein